MTSASPADFHTPHGVWEQVAAVRACLTGNHWQQRFLTVPPLPAWMVELVDGKVGTYAGPDPVLFRTAGLGVEWFDAAAEHPEQLRIVPSRSSITTETMLDLAGLFQEHGAVIDLDAHVFGDDNPESSFVVMIPTMYAVFPTQEAADRSAAAARWRGFLTNSHRTPDGYLLDCAPRLGELAW